MALSGAVLKASGLNKQMKTNFLRLSSVQQAFVYLCLLFPFVLSVRALGADAAAEVSAEERSPFDLTGTWVSIVSEDWRVRMLMGQKGDWLFLMGKYGSLNRRGLDEAESADPLAADPCMAYGAAGIMRIPGRVRISWSSGDVLKLEFDAGNQVRDLYFGSSAIASGNTAQGFSKAEFIDSQLFVETTNLLPGYYFKHGVPYSDQAELSEIFTVLDDGEADYLFVTTTVKDPVYLNGYYDRTLTFKRETDDSKWSAQACSVP